MTDLVKIQILIRNKYIYASNPLWNIQLSRYWKYDSGFYIEDETSLYYIYSISI